MHVLLGSVGGFKRRKPLSTNHLGSIRSAQLKDNTLVFITSDNGGARESHDKRAFPGRKLKGLKGSVFDGAIRVPIIVRWPGVIPKNTVNDSLIASFDLFPTLAELTGSPLPVGKFPGNSFLSVLLDNSLKIRRSPLFWEEKHSNRAFRNRNGMYNEYAVRDGNWKHIFKPAGNPKSIPIYKLPDPAYWLG